MKLLMIILDQSHKEELEVFLDHNGVAGYTEVSPVRGTGRSGPRLGSGTFPATSAIVFTLLDDDALVRVRDGLDDFCRDCGERPRMISWSVDDEQ